MASELDLNTRINLRSANVLLVDANTQALDVMRQILGGFCVQTVLTSENAADARKHFLRHMLDLIIIDPLLTEGDGFELISWMRREEGSPNHTAPIISAIRHLTVQNVRASRDAGANFVVAKPLSPEVLVQRIGWIARSSRQFVVSEGYVGPDRRFKNEGPPIGTDGRRSDDLPLEMSGIADANMSQSEVDELLKPRRVAL